MDENLTWYINKAKTNERIQLFVSYSLILIASKGNNKIKDCYNATLLNLTTDNTTLLNLTTDNATLLILIIATIQLY